jgi:hypothetical protein
MDSFRLLNKQGSSITNWQGWERPKKKYQWKGGRSAMELARAWFPNDKLTCPPELDALLQSSPRTANYQLTEGQPEFVTPLPERGEGRNHDLWLRAHCSAGDLTICVEAKADEPFGNLISAEIKKARERNAKTRLPARAEALLQLLFGKPCNPGERPWSELRYQLITALAGTAIQATSDKSPTAVFVVHEFLGSGLNPERQRQNEADIKAVVTLLMPGCNAFRTNALVGPVQITSGPNLARSVDLLIGRIQSPVASAGAQRSDNPLPSSGTP